jgi:hypothetical protein
MLLCPARVCPLCIKGSSQESGLGMPIWVFDSVNWYQLRAPSIRLFSGEWVGKHKFKRHEIILSKT